MDKVRVPQDQNSNPLNLLPKKKMHQKNTVHAAIVELFSLINNLIFKYLMVVAD